MKLRWRFYILENRVRKLQFLQVAHMTRHLVHLKYIYFKNGLLNRLKLETFVRHIVELVVGKHGVITMRLLVKVRVTFHDYKPMINSFTDNFPFKSVLYRCLVQLSVDVFTY